tara:strand:+ start:425 stop:1273 length:849 start_codon:yes stop_codon:yes gene_type:complete
MNSLAVLSTIGAYTNSDIVKLGVETAISNSEPGIIGKSLVVIGSIFMGCFIGFSIVALTEPKRDVSKFIDNSDDPRVAERRAIHKYQQKYADELTQLESKELTDDDLKELGKLQVKEDTPFGEIIMTYNPNTESFWYYTDARNVPFKTLDAVARCFAVTYDCKKICVNYKEELAALRDQCKKSEKTSESECKGEGEAKTGGEDDTASENDNKKKSIFATFKNYSTDTNKKSESSNFPIIMQNNNRFSCKGKIKDAPNQLEESSEDVNPNQNISFADFKKKQH